MMEKRKNLVIGVGNILLSDEGIGIHVVRRLESRARLKDCSFIDLGTSSLDIQNYIDESTKKIAIIDCIRSDDYGPGTVFRLKAEDIKTVKGYDYSLHQLELADALRLVPLNLDMPPIIIFGIVPKVIDVFSEDLSVPLKSRFDDIVLKIEGHIEEFIRKEHA